MLITFASAAHTACVTDVAVAMDAILHLTTRLRGQHVIHIVGVAIQARVLCHFPIARLNLNRFVEFTGGECERVEKAVVALGDPLSHKIVGEVAVVAGCNISMTRLRPSVVVRLHDVAVGASRWIVAEICGTFAISERESTESSKYAQHAGAGYGQGCDQSRAAWQLETFA